MTLPLAHDAYGKPLRAGDLAVIIHAPVDELLHRQVTVLGTVPPGTAFIWVGTHRIESTERWLLRTKLAYPPSPLYLSRELYCHGGQLMKIGEADTGDTDESNDVLTTERIEEIADEIGAKVTVY